MSRTQPQLVVFAKSFREKQIACRRWLSLAGLLACLAPAIARADTTLWYNGDSNGGGGPGNEESSNFGPARVFENFTVTSPGGWMVDAVWSNDQMRYTGVTSATWSIRTGMSTGNAGTIVATGTNFATQTATGRGSPIPGYSEYTIEVSGLSVYLAPGNYWLEVSPFIGNDPLNNSSFSSYVSITTGANAVGQPAGNDAGGFLYWPFTGYNYSSSLFGEDYSLGVAGVVVPEPATWMLLTAGGILVVAFRKSSLTTPFGLRRIW